MDSGSISVGGMYVCACSREVLAKNFSILRQENNFTSKLTVKQLVSFERYPYSKGRLTKEDMEIIEKYIEFLELSGLENRYLDELSGWQR